MSEKTPAINGLAERQTIVKSLFSCLVGIYRVFVVKLKVKTYHPLSRWATRPFLSLSGCDGELLPMGAGWSTSRTAVVLF